MAVISQAQEPESPPPASSAELNTKELVTVDWIGEMRQGGIVVIVQGLLSVALLAFILERFLLLKPARFTNTSLVAKVRPLFREGRYAEIESLCRHHPGVLASAILFIIQHRYADTQLIVGGAVDLAGRAMDAEERRCVPFSLIAGVAPLLGLLGTMIGMIEAFKLVEVFGDEGGASLLAGSISKALITTAVGLIIAVPAMLAYFYFKNRTQRIADSVQEQIEELFASWFMRHQETPVAHATETLAMTQEETRNDV